MEIRTCVATRLDLVSKLGDETLSNGELGVRVSANGVDSARCAALDECEFSMTHSARYHSFSLCYS
jgi:hypothetical protein